LWKEACAATKEEANVKAVELQTITWYYREVTHNLFETREAMLCCLVQKRVKPTGT
jgi:hypothetical protein